jgi:hypothetical protein
MISSCDTRPNHSRAVCTRRGPLQPTMTLTCLAVDTSGMTSCRSGSVRSHNNSHLKQRTLKTPRWRVPHTERECCESPTCALQPASSLHDAPRASISRRAYTNEQSLCTMSSQCAQFSRCLTHTQLRSHHTFPVHAHKHDEHVTASSRRIFLTFAYVHSHSITAHNQHACLFQLK